MKTYHDFLFFAFLLSFSFVFAFSISANEANAICTLIPFITDSNYQGGACYSSNPTCPSTYVSGNNCLYDVCGCNIGVGEPSGVCDYDSSDSTKVSCSSSMRDVPEPGWCTNGEDVCTTSGSACNVKDVFLYASSEGKYGADYLI